ncbi:SGNH-hydro domain-containing protein [Fusarium sp. LHS14.1]|nr:SGNH-hydro domain-containing protein [Fusarium sp. LHS14.1]
MSRLVWHCLAITALIQQATPFPSFPSLGSMLIPRDGNQFDDVDSWDASDLSYITKLAAIGDSYSAGIGAGNRLGDAGQGSDSQSDWSCGRHDNAYPSLVNQDGRLGDKSKRRFQFQSCSGATLEDLRKRQIPHIDKGQQVILVSAGANDAEFVNILNHCIYQWASFDSSEKAFDILGNSIPGLLKDYPHLAEFQIEELTRSCDEQLEISRELVESDEFGQKIDDVLKEAKRKLARDGTIYYTGYAKLFSTTMTESCNKVSWSTWTEESHDYARNTEHLTIDLRTKINDLVDLINQKLASAVEKAGSSVQFVDYDSVVGDLGGRYCEDGVDERTSKKSTRFGLMFYELNTADQADKTPFDRSEDRPGNKTFSGSQNVFAHIALAMGPDAKFTFDQNANGTALSDFNMPMGNDDSTSSDGGWRIPNVLPDGYARTFHPQILLHQVIANRIIFDMMSQNNKVNGYGELPRVTEMGSCRADSGPTTYLTHQGAKTGELIQKGVKLRILPVGDSITYGRHEAGDGGDGNGYRGRLKEHLTQNTVVFAGARAAGTMENGNFAAWPGKTIQFMADHVDPSLLHRPNLILLHAGTNDLEDRARYSTEGNDPQGMADRLGALIDQMFEACPDAVMLVAMILPTCDPHKSANHEAFISMIPSLVKERRLQGRRILAVDFTDFPLDQLYDCIHPKPDGYHKMGDWWYDYLTQIPPSWVTEPIGDDPVLPSGDGHRYGGVKKPAPAPEPSKAAAVS